MKRLFILALTITLLLGACDRKKTAQQVEENIQPTDTVMLDDTIKSKAIELYTIAINARAEAHRVARVVDIEFVHDSIFVPLQTAELAQTADQKAKLAGMYVGDAMVKRYFLGHDVKESMQMVSKLMAELNMTVVAGEDEDTGSDERLEDYSTHLVNAFKKELDCGENVDKELIIFNYACLEMTYLLNYIQEVYPLEVQESNAEKYTDQMQRSLVSLYDLLIPHYSSLASTTEIVECMRACHLAYESKDAQQQEAAAESMQRTCCAQRYALLHSLLGDE
ncbi:MAG: hypothetical protein HUK03_02875 [Bacteroidaceae bacterium]|nr:hypothetical protein [Bacteroidaceae bacterium]